MPCGIYQIRHIESGKVYIGSSNNTKRRWTQHSSQMRRGCHPNKKLSNAVNKYGVAGFVFELLEQCERENLILREKFWIDAKNAVDGGYNVRRQPDSSLGVALSAEAKAKLKQLFAGRKMPPQAIAASVAARTGRPLSESTRRKISEAHKGRGLTAEHKEKISVAKKGQVVSLETRKKLSEFQIGRKFSPERRAALRGRVDSAETKAKRSATAKANRAKKNAESQSQALPPKTAHITMSNLLDCFIR